MEWYYTMLFSEKFYTTKPIKFFMKKQLLFVLMVCLFIPKSQAQDDGLIAAAAGIAAIGAAFASIEQLKEQAELTAMEWLINNRPEMTGFSLKTLDFDGKKAMELREQYANEAADNGWIGLFYHAKANSIAKIERQDDNFRIVPV